MNVRFAVAAVVLLASPVVACGQDVAITRNPVRTFEDLLALLAGAESGLAQAKKGREHWDRGEFEPARKCFDESLATMRKQFPDDSVVVGMCHGMLCGYYWAIGDPAAALPHARKHLSSADNIPRNVIFPQSEVNKSLALNNLGGVLEDLGDLAEAEKLYREALALRRKLSTDPDGGFDIVTSLGNLASVLAARGEYAAAEGFAKEAHDMAMRLLDGKGKSHAMVDASAVARALNNLAETRRLQGDDTSAALLQANAIGFREQAFPAGHPDLAMNIRNLGITHADRGDWAKATAEFDKALAMLRKFYPAGTYPQGHPKLCQVTRDLGATRAAMGDRDAAERHLRDALRMADTLFPSARFPEGHPALALCLTELGALELARPGGNDAAARSFREALAVTTRHTNAIADSLAEAEVVNLVRSLPANLNGLLSATREGPFDPRDYQYVWASKAAAMRVLERRRRLLLASSDREAERISREIEATRAELSIKLLSPTRPDAAALTARKETLERELAGRLRLPGPPTPDRSHPFELMAKLPPNSAFVDMVGYTRVTQDPRVPGREGRGLVAHYAAFVVAPGRRPERVELGPGEPIHAAVESWRAAIAAPYGKADERGPARDVARLLWNKIADRLPAGTETVYLAPDAALNRIPFAALPGRTKDVLLEELTIAVVPHGPFLLDRLKNPTPARADAGKLLVVGGVDYGEPGAGAPAGGKEAKPLPGTAEEAGLVQKLARDTGRAEPVVLTRAEASTAAVLENLPTSRYAHFATHGFFAGREAFAASGLDPGAFHAGPRDLRTAGARNPLVLNGLVLAGANRTGPDARPDRGLLTAEALAGRRLDGMDLAVLSACETGLGHEVAGEGVFGLQRSFHVAGCRTVVASLWQVDDGTTRELMEKFYRHLWAGGADMTPAKALRAAQLELYRSLRTTGERRPRVVVLSATPAPPPPPDAGPVGRFDADTNSWAAFVVSGAP